MSETPLKTETDADSGEDEVIVGATGQDLKEQREALGASLSDVSDTLCIRRDFIEALESGDYDVLPGHAYAVGFVRSYAKHLGLDADRIARQFKAEITGEHPTAKLDFLTPVSESRVPTGAVVFVAILLALAVYGLWYFMNAQDMSVSDVVPEIPAGLVGTEVEPASGTATGSVEGPAPESPSPAAGAAAPQDAPAVEMRGAADTATTLPGSAGPETGNQAGGDTASPDGRGAAGAEPPAADAARPAPSDAAQPSLPHAAEPPAPEQPALPAASEPNLPQTEPAQLPQVAENAPSGSEVAESVSAPEERPASAPETQAPPADQVASAAKTVRIVLRAKSDSWVEIRTEEGSLVISRILRQGTDYDVPDRPGLSLTIGNAGGLEIVVDGAAIPSLGPIGAVRRDIALDPARLKAGTAYSR